MLMIRRFRELTCLALALQIPADKAMRVVPETTRQTMYLQAKGGLRY
jgi:hypothetical protein